MINKDRPLVHIVDDDESVRAGLRWLFESAGLQAECYESAEAFLNSQPQDRPACLLLDVRMPGMNGLQLQEELLRQGSILPIIILTGHGDVPMAVKAMQSGAFDFVQKPFNGKDLYDRVLRAIDQSRERLMDAAARDEIVRRYERLTPREREVLERIVAGAANKVIALELGIVMRTVEVHRHNVMEKMGAASLSDLVQRYQRLSARV